MLEKKLGYCNIRKETVEIEEVIIGNKEAYFVCSCALRKNCEIQHQGCQQFFDEVYDIKLEDYQI